jgi:homoserine kinase
VGELSTGLALSIYLELHVKVTSKTSSDKPLNCVVTYENPDGTADDISLDPEVNLITRVALYVLRCHEQHAFPAETYVHIINPVPLGRGLGSSGTAVVAGVMLANEVGKLGLKKERLLDYCLMIGLFHKNRSSPIFYPADLFIYPSLFPIHGLRS